MAITKTPGRYDEATQSWLPGTEVTETTHAGRVLRVYHESYRAMSDVYTTATFAEVVNDDGSTSGVLVNANFECDVSGGQAKVDATQEVILGHFCWLERQHVLAEERRVAQQAIDAETAKNRPAVGKKMEACRGKYAGVSGTVAFIKGAKALIKDDAHWNDRQAQGTWVPLTSLKAR